MVVKYMVVGGNLRFVNKVLKLVDKLEFERKGFLEDDIGLFLYNLLSEPKFVHFGCLDEKCLELHERLFLVNPHAHYFYYDFKRKRDYRFVLNCKLQGIVCLSCNNDLVSYLKGFL
jgi:hypothetical protein